MQDAIEKLAEGFVQVREAISRLETHVHHMQVALAEATRANERIGMLEMRINQADADRIWIRKQLETMATDSKIMTRTRQAQVFELIKAWGPTLAAWMAVGYMATRGGQ